MTASLISFPQEAFDASIRGLNMWWEIVFPSLLPFFIISEMLIGFGVVRFIGVLLEPLMRPIFRVPGVGGFVWAMGMASGYPAGAKLTARLRQNEQLTQIEAERLVSFTNSSNPLFIFGAVSVGFFHNPQLGIMLAIGHYVGNILVGFLMRFHGRDEWRRQKDDRNSFSILAALRALHRTRIQDNRPIGKLLGDAVLSSIQTLLMIGGFIIIFSVLNKLLFLLGITAMLGQLVQYILTIIQFPVELSIPYISGLFEITLGSQLTSQVKDATLMQQTVLVSFILAFSGFSVQAQVASILADTDIRFKPFFLARIAHGCFAAAVVFFLWTPVYERFLSSGAPSNALPVYAQPSLGFWDTMLNWLQMYGPLVTIFGLLCYVVIYARRKVLRL
ncbi:sporulation integral membrane protein YlbJ [Bacillus fonticola]|uniref:sporulation integral membrane protein YlbJ n=1 Tax=Bacillus fonticola TaxID=2728853 RepID=UPI00224053EB|nr:sporulation integral membrane protein YlbJ [Bacillus fonticola]